MNTAQRESLISFYIVWEALRPKEEGVPEYIGAKIIRDSVKGYLEDFCNYNVEEINHGNEE